MSKSLRNYPDVNEVFDRDGSDAMRWFLMSSPVLRGGNLVVTEEGIREGVRQVLLPLWNTWYFFSLYANATGYEAKRSTASTDVLDRYLLAKTRDLVEAVTADLEVLDSTLAAAKLRDFADVLTNWYVRRSRDRFWEGVGEDGSGTEAFDTLYTVLETVTRVAAPLLPLVSERIWKDLTGGRSVHLTDWPEAAEFPADDALVDAMDRIRAISSTALSLRKQAGKRVRLPLASLTVVAHDAGALAVHFPSIDDQDLAELFGSETQDEIDKFERCDWTEGPGGLPLLDRLGNRITGAVVSRIDDGGDHECFVIAVDDMQHDARLRQLGFQDVRDLEPGHPA
jgi:isoleucyl-tRNA synthetase